MTNQEVLEKAIAKAIESGWKHWNVPMFKFIEASTQLDTGELHITYQLRKNTYWSFTASTLIFNHDFAKSLWGEEKWWTAQPGKSGDKHNDYQLPAYKMHLQQMVTAEDPIAYLGGHL